MRAKIVEIPTFNELYDLAPTEIKDYIDRCERTPQSPDWHPEGDVKNHIKIVYNRARKTGDINLALAAFFHDLGKADVTKPSTSTPGSWSAHGHERVSARLVDKYANWIEELGGNSDEVYDIVKQHMRIKQYNVMRPHKRKAMEEDPLFPKYQQFTQFDDMQTLTQDELKYI